MSRLSCLCLLGFCRNLNWLCVPTSCCSLLCCLGKRKECNQKRGQQQRAVSEPATHASHSLARPRRSSVPSENKGSCQTHSQTHSCGCQMRYPASERLSCPSAMQHSGNSVHGLLTEIQLGLLTTKCQLQLCPLIALPSPVLSAQAVTLQWDSYLVICCHGRIHVLL